MATLGAASAMTHHCLEFLAVFKLRTFNGRERTDILQAIPYLPFRHRTPMNQLLRISAFLTILSLAPGVARADKGSKLEPKLAKPGEVYQDNFESSELG